MTAILQLNSYIRELNLLSILLRLLLSMLFGGIVGLDRERKRRPAGFRTYMLVSLGAALTMLLGQYEYSLIRGPWAAISAEIGIKTDVARIGAQVINGIGFLGAGTILVTGRHEVKGLTTAAGLWTCACMGLAAGAGFYECAIIGFAFIIICIKFFSAVDNYFITHSRNLNVYIRFGSVTDVGEILSLLRSRGILIYEMELDKRSQIDAEGAAFELLLPKGADRAQIAAEIAGLSCVKRIEEL